MRIQDDRRRLRKTERRQDGDRHADHAVEIALPRRRRARQPSERQDEKNAGGEVEQCGDVCGHWIVSRA